MNFLQLKHRNTAKYTSKKIFREKGKIDREFRGDFPCLPPPLIVWSVFINKLVTPLTRSDHCTRNTTKRVQSKILDFDENYPIL
jgi:hypothetical protein